LIAETTLTREQAALKLWCDKLHALVDFTSDTTAIVYWRMAGRWRIGEIEYILSGDRWCAHIDRVHRVYVNQENTNANHN
jgi:hypothetical protein